MENVKIGLEGYIYNAHIKNPDADGRYSCVIAFDSPEDRAGLAELTEQLAVAKWGKMPVELLEPVRRCGEDIPHAYSIKADTIFNPTTEELAEEIPDGTKVQVILRGKPYQGPHKTTVLMNIVQLRIARS